jgi:FkbM family methyltransferase
MDRSGGVRGVISDASARSKQEVRRIARRRMARGTFSLNGDRVLTTNPDGLAMYVNAADTSLTPSILTRRMYEPGTTRLVRRLVRPGHRVLDVGANIGWHTLISGERVGPSGHVRSFEPNPHTFEFLHSNIFINGLWDRCTAVQSALGPADGEAVLRIPGTYTGGANLREKDAGALNWMAQTDQEVAVKVMKLDDALSDNLHYDLFKIDVEGYEAEVFAGAEQFFGANPDLKVIMEFTPSQHGQPMLDWIAQRGFRAHTIDRFGRTHQVGSLTSLLQGSSFDVLLSR